MHSKHTTKQRILHLGTGFPAGLGRRHREACHHSARETIEIDGTQTRVVEEREWRNGELIEASRNFFDICEQTEDVFYFGEEVDMYSGGQLASHSGAWWAGEDNARPALIMPSRPSIIKDRDGTLLAP
jgi:hypothetical protein